jgi:hypothetical protein
MHTARSLYTPSINDKCTANVLPPGTKGRKRRTGGNRRAQPRALDLTRRNESGIPTRGPDDTMTGHAREFFFCVYVLLRCCQHVLHNVDRKFGGATRPPNSRFFCKKFWALKNIGGKLSALRHLGLSLLTYANSRTTFYPLVI